MSDFGIVGVGVYVPRLRLARSAIAAAHAWMAPGLKGQAKGERAFCGWDEDPITMAVEAARDCLSGDTSGIAALTVASTRFPYADLQNSSIVAAALGLPAATATLDVAHSQRAGTSGLLAALWSSRDGLFVAADCPIAKPASAQELTYGAGAAAFRLGREGVVARLRGAATITRPFVDHFRADGERHDYFWEERWIRDEGYMKLVPQAIRAALADAGVEMDAIAHFVMPSLVRGAAEAVAKKLKFAGAVASGLDDGVGYAGAAHAPLMLAHLLEIAKPGELVLLVGFGQGADALVLEVTNAIQSARKGRCVSGALADRISTDAYLRMLSFQDGIALDWGMRAEKNAKTALTEQHRAADQIDAFMAGKCAGCGTVQFPQLQYCVNCQAPAAQFSDVPLADEPAEVLTSTADWLSYYPAPPLHVGFVQFDNGARLLMEMVDVGPAGIDTGTKLRMVFRVKEKDRQRGYQRYFWKATPIAAA